PDDRSGDRLRRQLCLEQRAVRVGDRRRWLDMRRRDGLNTEALLRQRFLLTAGESTSAGPVEDAHENITRVGKRLTGPSVIGERLVFAHRGEEPPVLEDVRKDIGGTRGGVSRKDP